MSDDAAKHFDTEAKPEALPTEGRSVTLSVTMHPNGQIEFSMPRNKVLAHGLLGVAQAQLAKLDVMEEVAKAQAKVQQGNSVAGLMKRMRGG